MFRASKRKGINGDYCIRVQEWKTEDKMFFRADSEKKQMVFKGMTIDLKEICGGNEVNRKKTIKEYLLTQEITVRLNSKFNFHFVFL